MKHKTEHMMRYNPSDRFAPVGFTLLEILIAIMIFAVAATTIYGSLRAVLSRNEAINHGADVFEMARNCLNRIVFDLTSMYVDPPPLYKPPGFNDPPDPYRFVAEESYVGTKSFSRLRFASTAHLPLSGTAEKGLARIVYYVEEREYPQSDYVLKRADAAYPYDAEDRVEESDSDPILCKNVEAFSLTCYDEEGEAYETWDSDSDDYKHATPRMVEIRLTLNRDNETHTFYTKVILPVYREEMENKKK